MLVAASQHNLGVVLHKQGRHAEARELLEEALRLRRQHYGETHSRVATTLNVLATTSEEAGDLAAAHSHYLKSLDVRRQLYPEGHPDIAGVLFGPPGVTARRLG